MIDVSYSIVDNIYQITKTIANQNEEKGVCSHVGTIFVNQVIVLENID